MNRPLFALIVALIVIVAFLAMWWGWRARTRRDAAVATSVTPPEGALIAEFSRVFYVSTTPVGEPLARVAVKGLRYRGRAEVAVHEGGVTIEVDGEDPVHLVSSQLRGSSAAARRVGKAVEQGGLALLVWVPDGEADTQRRLESSFRFNSADDQTRFAEAIDHISVSPLTSQEGAQ